MTASYRGVNPANLPIVLLALSAAMALGCLGGCTRSTQTFSHGRFKHVEVFRPRGQVKHFALLMSGDGGWNSKLATIADALAAQGTMVAGIDTAELFSDLERDGGSCVAPDGDLENLSHYIQAYYKLPTYFTPILIGHSAGATLAYTTLAQAPPGIFSGALTLSFCVDLDLHKPLCETGSLRYEARADGSRLLPPPHLPAPWIALHGERDDVCPISEARTFIAQTPGARLVPLPSVTHNYAGTRDWLPQLESAFDSLAQGQTQHLPSPPASLGDLPVVEVPAVAPAEGPLADEFAVLISGDGGWAGIDKEVAGLLAAHGVPTAGVDSLRYFWAARTPQQLARDIDRIVTYYRGYWHRQHVILIGYSQGADVLPFAVNRLAPTTRAAISLTALIGISHSATFEFHLANWMGSDTGGLPVAPEINRLSAVDTLCIYGDDDHETICPQVAAQHARVIEMPGGHHFGGHYEGLADLILSKATDRAH